MNRFLFLLLIIFSTIIVSHVNAGTPWRVSDVSIEIVDDSVQVAFLSYPYMYQGYLKKDHMGYCYLKNDSTLSINIGWMNVDVESCENDSLVCACDGLSFKYPLGKDVSMLEVNCCVLWITSKENNLRWAIKKINTVSEILQNDKLEYKVKKLTSVFPIYVCDPKSAMVDE